MGKVTARMVFLPFLLSNTIFFTNHPIFNQIERLKKQKFSYQMQFGIFINSRPLGDFLNAGGIIGDLSFFSTYLLRHHLKILFFFLLHQQSNGQNITHINFQISPKYLHPQSPMARNPLISKILKLVLFFSKVCVVGTLRCMKRSKINYDNSFTINQKSGKSGAKIDHFQCFSDILDGPHEYIDIILSKSCHTSLEYQQGVV